MYTQVCTALKTSRLQMFTFAYLDLKVIQGREKGTCGSVRTWFRWYYTKTEIDSGFAKGLYIIGISKYTCNYSTYTYVCTRVSLYRTLAVGSRQFGHTKRASFSGRRRDAYKHSCINIYIYTYKIGTKVLFQTYDAYVTPFSR